MPLVGTIVGPIGRGAHRERPRGHDHHPRANITVAEFGTRGQADPCGLSPGTCRGGSLSPRTDTAARLGNGPSLHGNTS